MGQWESNRRWISIGFRSFRVHGARRKRSDPTTRTGAIKSMNEMNNCVPLFGCDSSPRWQQILPKLKRSFLLDGWKHEAIGQERRPDWVERAKRDITRLTWSMPIRWAPIASSIWINVTFPIHLLTWLFLFILLRYSAGFCFRGREGGGDINGVTSTTSNDSNRPWDSVSTVDSLRIGLVTPLIRSDKIM